MAERSGAGAVGWLLLGFLGGVAVTLGVETLMSGHLHAPVAEDPAAATTPRLAVRTSTDLAERLQTALEATAQSCGYAGQIVVRADPGLPTAAFVLDWGDGRASFDPIQAAERVAEALRSAVEAEGLHAEPVLPQSET